ncbi:MAG: LicD family protein [Clostridia bacterium]|nr:LicD family protein [Clostridia bacterium]
MKKIETLAQLQQVALYIYKDLLACCEQHGLKLYLLGGTLIGAVRHKGFIPWDDDVDVCMSRPDFEKLLEVTGGQISDKCAIINPAGNPDFKGCVPVAVYKNSSLLSKQFKEAEKLCIGISIFVYDGAPKSKLARAYYYTKMYILRAEHALCRADFKNVNTKAAKLVGPILSPFFKSEDVFKYREKILKWQKKYPYETSEYVSTNADNSSWKEVFPRRSFEQAVELEFEGKKCYAFSHYKEHLTRYYGDYMQLPPEEARIPKHSFDAEIEDSFVFEKTATANL